MFCRFTVQHLRSFSSQQLPAQVIFSFDSKSSFIEKVNRMKLAYPSTKTMSKRAAVLIPLVSVDGEASLLFTARSRQLRNHRGEICYPGGKFDDTSDTTILDAALRETEEELGINRSLFDVWAELPPLPSRDGKTAVTPVVAMLKVYSAY